MRIRLKKRGRQARKAAVGMLLKCKQIPPVITMESEPIDGWKKWKCSKQKQKNTVDELMAI